MSEERAGYPCIGCSDEQVPWENGKCIPCADAGVRAWVIERDRLRREKELALARGQIAQEFKKRMTKKRK